MFGYSVLCGSNTVVPGTTIHDDGAYKTVTYVHQKVEHTQTFQVNDVFPEFEVTILTVKDSRVPCLLLLPQPFNRSLRYGNVLLFQYPVTLDFCQTWNTCCMRSMTWQHNRQKKSDDPLQKLGLPPKLNDYLREQVVEQGYSLPQLSDDEVTEPTVDRDMEEKESDYDTSSTLNTESDKDDENDYLSNEGEDDYEDEGEEEEAEDENEPEVDEIEDNDDIE